jgi:hypothetical protein
VVIGGLLSVIVGKRRFGKKIRTEDVVYAKTVDVFNKGLTEDASMEDMVKNCRGTRVEGSDRARTAGPGREG